MAKIPHSVDGRFTVMVDEEDIEIARLMLTDAKTTDIAKAFMADGRSLTEAMAIISEAKRER